MGKNKVSLRYQRVKDWLFDQSEVSISSIHEAFKVKRSVAAAIFQQLQMDKYIQAIDSNKKLWFVSRKKLLDNKKGLWPLDLANGVRALLEKTEKSCLEWQKRYDYNTDSNPLGDNFHINKPVQFLDPLQAFIYFCQANLKTLILSDTLNQESLALFLISRLSQIPVERILVGNIIDAEWPKLVMASAVVSDWAGAIETKYKNGLLNESEFMKLCKDPKYEVLIFDFKKDGIFLTKATLKLAKQNKKILVFPKSPNATHLRTK